MAGTYAFVYCGVNGVGIGVFTVAADGLVRGSDYSGAKYDGSATENPDGSITLELSFEVPAGAALVMGTSAQAVPHTRRIQADMPANFGDGKPQEVPLPPSVVTVMIKRVPDDFAPAADGFTMTLAQRLAVHQD